MLDIREILAALLTLILLATAPGCQPLAGGGGRHSAAEREQALLPVQEDANIIVVSFDALRPDALGVYGSTRGATPNMDAFAEESVVVADAYSVAPVTPTSFAAAFSGLLPTRVFHAWELRAPSTLADRLNDAGYYTAAFVNNVQLTPERGFDAGFDLYEWSRNDADEEVVERVLAWLDEGPPRPFFLWVHFLTPHAPYRARPEAQHLYRERAVGRYAKTSGNEFATTDAAELGRLHDLYLGEVWRSDQVFGRLSRRLELLGLLRTSLVVLTSDHGEEFGEHGGFQHGRVYEEHIRVPLIVRHPALTGGRTVDLRVRNVDLLPTLLHSVGHPIDDTLDGRVIPVPRHDAPPALVVAISMTGAKERWVSITQDPLKLILTCRPHRAVELYDLLADPGEQRDLGELHPGKVRILLAALRTVLGGPTCTTIDQAARGKAPTVGLDAESIEALRALGYLN